MKKIISILLSVIFVLTLFVSCGDPADKLVGKWEGDESITFNDDGTVKVIEEGLPLAGTYSVETEGEVTLNFVLAEETYEYSVDGDTLTLDGDTYTKVK
jgi:hypothetical protein